MNPFRSVGALLSIALSLVVVGRAADRLLHGRSVASEPPGRHEDQAARGRRAGPALGVREDADARGDSPTLARRGDRCAGGDVRVLDRYLAAAHGQLARGAESRTARERPDRRCVPRRAIRSSTGPSSATAIRSRRSRFRTAGPGGAILLIAPLASQYQTIHVVKRRLLIAGLVGLLVALGVGYGGAWAFARRIKRLERAAERISAGRFDEPVVDHSLDELGELARAFDRMRLRLASSTTPGASSSRTRRTSCGRRCSRSAASWSYGRRGSGRGDTPRVPRRHARAGRPADAARDRPARPVAARRRPHSRRQQVFDLAPARSDRR